MLNKNQQITKKVLTDVDLASFNNRNDDSLSFTSGGQLIANQNNNDHKARIIATSDGKVWLQPASNGSQIDLTQTALSDEQLRNINDISNISNELRKDVEPTLRNQVLPTLEKHFNLINDRSTIAVNNIQDQRLTSLETGVKELNNFEDETLNHLSLLEDRTRGHSTALNSLRGTNMYTLRINRFNAGAGQSNIWSNLAGEIVIGMIWNPRREVRLGDNANNNTWVNVTGNLVVLPTANSVTHFIPLNYGRTNSNLQANRCKNGC